MDESILIFDLDGTLIDTNELIRETFRRTFKKFLPELSFREEELNDFLGPTLISSFRKHAKNEKELEEMILFYRKENDFLAEKYISVYPMIFETLDILRKNGYKLYIVTSKLRAVAINNLKLVKMDKYFLEVIGGESCRKPKPDPEGILKILKLAGKYKEAYMIGDNDSDIFAGQNADIKTVFVNWSIKTPFSKPDYKIDRIDDLFEILKISKEGG